MLRAFSRAAYTELARLEGTEESQVRNSVTRDPSPVAAFPWRARNVSSSPHTASAEVQTCAAGKPLPSRPLRSHSTFPLVWLPWQRNQLAPYLLPPELPESELGDLTDYAMSFVRRNDDDLFDTLMDVNQTIFEEYRYVPGSTHLGTTAYQVHAVRQGVCQDFANLFICMMRLLGVPARYVCGYVYTGPRSSPPHPHAEASHAWVQVYLPEVGWVGFDPTNGILTQTDHVRVAVGRAYADATPPRARSSSAAGASSWRSRCAWSWRTEAEAGLGIPWSGGRRTPLVP